VSGPAYMPQAKSQDWQTPPALFDALDKEFGPFTCDPACNGSEHSAKIILDRGGLLCWPAELMRVAATTDFGNARVRCDGLIQPWEGIVYLNPPYGTKGGMAKWIAKAVAEVECGNAERVVALIPSRTDTKMWQTAVVKEAAYDLNPVPTDIKPRVLTTAIDLEDGTASLERAMEVAAYFELDAKPAGEIAAEVGQAVETWRAEAARLGLTSSEIDRMASAFEHQDLHAALKPRSTARRTSR